MYVFFVTLFFCKEKKKVTKECLTKQHLRGEKEGKVHLGGGPGYFRKKKKIGPPTSWNRLMHDPATPIQHNKNQK